MKELLQLNEVDRYEEVEEIEEVEEVEEVKDDYERNIYLGKMLDIFQYRNNASESNIPTTLC